MKNLVRQRGFAFFGLAIMLGPLWASTFHQSGNAFVIIAQSQKSDTGIKVSNILPSGKLTRHINNPIIPMGPSGSIDEGKTGPRVVLKEGAMNYKMWYEAVDAPNASTVGYATSVDGKTWTKQGAVLSPSASWESGADGEVSPNTILVEDGIYKMWYHSFGSDRKRRIGYATSPNGINWTKNPNPVLNLGPAGSFDDYFVTEPRVFNLGNGQYRMYYGAVRKSQQGFGVYRLMTATSSDGISWTKQNRVLFGPYDSGYAIVRDGDKWHMWYGLSNKGLAYASSNDGLTWTPGPNNPVLSWNPNPAAPDSQGVGDSVSGYKDGNEFRIMYTGGRYNSFGRNESICLATITAVECTYSINSISQNFTADEGTGNISVTTSKDCAWSATSNSSWITINSGAGTGDGSFSFTVKRNRHPARTGTISIGGQTFTVNQAKASTNSATTSF